jgi:hypothetical protein
MGCFPLRHSSVRSVSSVVTLVRWRIRAPRDSERTSDTLQSGNASATCARPSSRCGRSPQRDRGTSFQRALVAHQGVGQPVLVEGEVGAELERAIAVLIPSFKQPAIRLQGHGSTALWRTVTVLVRLPPLQRPFRKSSTLSPFNATGARQSVRRTTTGRESEKNGEDKAGTWNPERTQKVHGGIEPQVADTTDGAGMLAAPDPTGNSGCDWRPDSAFRLNESQSARACTIPLRCVPQRW